VREDALSGSRIAAGASLARRLRTEFAVPAGYSLDTLVAGHDLVEALARGEIDLDTAVESIAAAKLWRRIR
jgi:hypothetical protein